MATTVRETVDTNTATGFGGSTYTKSISNDTLSNQDFLQLMIQELKLQDPTKPTDSKQMLQSQMQMSSIQTNQDLAASMKSLESSLSNMSLTNAVNFMGKKVDAIVTRPVIDPDTNRPKRDNEGNVVTEKIKASFKIGTVKLENGVTYFESKELIGFKDHMANLQTGKLVDYDPKTGQIKDESGKKLDEYIKLDENGRFQRNASGDVVLVNGSGKIITPTYKPEKKEGETEEPKEIVKYKFYNTEEIYSQDTSNVKYEELVKIY